MSNWILFFFILGKPLDGLSPSSSSTNCTVSPAMLSLPMKQWNADAICTWFEQMGLFMYVADVRRNLRAGTQLMEVRDLSSS